MMARFHYTYIMVQTKSIQTYCVFVVIALIRGVSIVLIAVVFGFGDYFMD